jgi:hypothetical protein
VRFDSRRLPFTTIDGCADKALILKHEAGRTSSTD